MQAVCLHRAQLIEPAEEAVIHDVTRTPRIEA
jgi:hypothetical protein